MSALAKYLSTQGYVVSGSDAVKNEQTEALAFYGIKTYMGVDGARKELLEADLVVFTDAITPTNEELVFAIERKKKLLSRAQLLSIVSQNFPNVIAVAGSHGKTTCTSICAHALKSVGVPFTAHIGGEDSEFGNFYTNGNEYFLSEVCEYKRNLLKMQSSVAVVLNIDKDHMECYHGEDDLISCFREYCLQAKTAFVCADDRGANKLGDFATFGIENNCADYFAKDIKLGGDGYNFTVEEYGKELCRLRLQSLGKHNIYNALAAFAAMRYFGFDEREIKRGIENFRSVKRRFEKIGEYNGARFICDYAHHPREITATISMAQDTQKGRLFVVFQPHTYSRTKLLLKEFIEVLSKVDNLLIYKTFPAREKYDEEGSALHLAGEVGSLYAENNLALKTWIDKTVKEGDTVLFLGAGDIYYVAQYLCKGLK